MPACGCLADSLEYAAHLGNVNACKTLLDAGADPFLPDDARKRQVYHTFTGIRLALSQYGLGLLMEFSFPWVS